MVYNLSNEGFHSAAALLTSQHSDTPQHSEPESENVCSLLWLKSHKWPLLAVSVPVAGLLVAAVAAGAVYGIRNRGHGVENPRSRSVNFLLIANSSVLDINDSSCLWDTGPPKDMTPLLTYSTKDNVLLMSLKCQKTQALIKWDGRNGSTPEFRNLVKEGCENQWNSQLQPPTYIWNPSK